MGLTFTYWWPLALLAILPAVWWVRRSTLTNFGAPQLALQAAARATVVGLLALALAMPVLSLSQHTVSVVYAVDVSASVAPEAVTSALDWIEKATAAGHPAESRVIAFGATAGAFATAADARAHLEQAGEDGPVDPNGTDVEVAIRRALQEFAPGHVKRLVLMTDGRENQGQLARAIPQMHQEHVRVFTRALAPHDRGDAWVDGLSTSDVVSKDEPFPVTLSVFSQAPRAAVIALTAGGKKLESRTVKLKAGENIIPIDARVADTGPLVLEASVKADADSIGENDILRRAIFVESKPRVLYIEGRPESARYLRRALENGGFEVDVASPRSLPASAARLRGYAAIIVSDVPRTLVSDGQMNALASYVETLGGGLIVAGGEAMYGEGGYARTTLENVLPVTFSMKDKPDEFAMVVVLDKSWSMSGPKMELSKEAAKAAVDVLSDHHQFALVAFNNAFDWPITMRLAKERVWIKDRIAAIQPSGHTNIFPAMEQALLALQKIEARVKYCLLLSDGRTYSDDFETLTNKMVTAKITVSTVAVGDQADRELLANIARWGKGRSYYIEDEKQVPQIFAEETRQAARPTLVESPFRAVVKKDVEMLRGIDFKSAPLLRGYTNTQAKDTADVLLVSPTDDEPLLARWQYGLGKSVAFLSDVKDRWASDWLTWPGYGKFWSQLVRETMRHPEGREDRMRVTKDGARARIALDTVGEDGTFRALSDPRIEVTAPNQPASFVRASQVGPGSYEAIVPLESSADYVFRVVDGNASAPVARGLATSYPDEYRFLPPDTGLLQALSHDTGGVFDPQADDVFKDYGDSSEARHQLWPWLAGLALLIYLIDLALRRVRLFEKDVASIARPNHLRQGYGGLA